MTEPRVGQLLDELAEPVDAPHLADIAWARAARTRTRHRRVSVVAAVAVVAVLAAVLAIRLPAEHSRHTPAGHPSTTAPTEPSAPTLTVAHAPALRSEANLPSTSLGVPASIILDTHSPSVRARPIPAALMAFAVFDATGPAARLVGVVLVAPGGTQRSLDVHSLGPAPDRANGAVPFVDTSLSPDGTRLAFVQRNRLAVYSLATSSWRSYSTPNLPYTNADQPMWIDDDSVRVADRVIDLPGGATIAAPPPAKLDVPGARFSTPWGPARTQFGNTAQGGFVSRPTTPEDRTSQGIVASTPAGGAVLLIPWIPGQERYIGCCAAAGWADPHTVVYESRFGGTSAGQTTRLLSWQIPTGAVHLATTIRAGADRVFTGSYADLGG